MCPSVKLFPSAEIDLYWTDEQIISLLYDYTPQSRLPNNVLADSSPYQCPPSNLPEGFWYLVPSNENKESVHGFWKANGEACKIYSNSTIVGWRTTLQYFEGQAPDEQSSDWLMQEYWITEKELLDKDKPKESRLLCRVYCSDNCLKTEKHAQDYGTAIESKTISSLASVDHHNHDICSGQDSISESKAKRESELVTSPQVDDNKPNSPQQDFSELECFLRGDYLELDDLEEPESHSSSSQNSSCLSKLSDEAFDTSAFLRDIEEEEYNSMHRQQSSSTDDFTSVGPDDVVLQPTVSESLLTGSVRTDVVEGPQSSSTIHEISTDERMMENTTKRLNPESSTNEETSNGVLSPEKKAGGSGRMKKLKRYFCFKPL